MCDLELLTAKQVAERLQVSRATVYDWAQQGFIPTVRLRGTVRFRVKDVQRLIGGRVTRSRTR